MDIDLIARSTSGSTGADLENIVNQAAIKAAKEGDNFVTRQHLEFALDKVLMGIDYNMYLIISIIVYFYKYMKFALLDHVYSNEFHYMLKSASMHD